MRNLSFVSSKHRRSASASSMLLHCNRRRRAGGIFLLLLVFAAVLLSAAVSLSTAKKRQKLTSSELQELLDDIRGDDRRLVRWDATEHTAQKQAKDQHCDDTMLAAVDLLFDAKADSKTKINACEYVTFCVTDNPKQREVLASYDDDADGETINKILHKKVVELVGSKDAGLSAAAAHLIYISSYANRYHHQGYYHAGAIDALGSIVKNTRARADQIMWSAAALQNLAASYCEGNSPINTKENDGKCRWSWEHGYDAAQIDDDYLPVFSDGTSARKMIFHDTELVNKLIQLSCQAPIVGKEGTDANPFPGSNAEIGKHHENHSNIIGWAAIAALGNVALEPETHELLDKKALPCLCISQVLANDWLEHKKAKNAIYHFRHDAPCHFNVDNEEDKTMRIDYRYLDSDDMHCGKDTQCDSEKAVDVKTGMHASKACVNCGSGIHRAIDPNLITMLNRNVDFNRDGYDDDDIEDDDFDYDDSDDEDDDDDDDKDIEYDDDDTIDEEDVEDVVEDMDGDEDDIKDEL